MLSLVQTLSARYQKKRLQELADDFKGNGQGEGMVQARAIAMIPAMTDAFHKASWRLHEAARFHEETLLECVVRLVGLFGKPQEDLQCTEHAAQTLAVFFVSNFFTDEPVLPPCLSQKGYADAVLPLFPDACVQTAQQRARRLIKDICKQVFDDDTPKQILCEIVRSALYAFYPMKGAGSEAAARPGACKMICLSLGLARHRYQNDWLRKVVDEEVKQLKNAVKEGHVMPASSAELSNRLAAALKGVETRPEWRKETLQTLDSMVSRKVGASAVAVPVTSEMRKSALTSASTSTIAATSIPRDEHYVTLIVALCKELRMKTKKSHLFDWPGIRRAQRRMAAALAQAQAKAAAATLLAAENARRRPHFTGRRGGFCDTKDCKGVPVVDMHSGDRKCYSCGLCIAACVHGSARNFVDTETKQDYRQHVENKHNEERTQLTGIDQSHRLARSYNVAFQKVRDGRYNDDTCYGMKNATPHEQMKTARVLFEMLEESADLPVGFVRKACAYFNAYREGPGANAMNFIEVACAAGLVALPPELVSCIGTCSTVAMVGGVPLPTMDAAAIAERMGQKRGGLKVAVLVGTQVSVLEQPHVCEDVDGSIVVVSGDRVLRLHGRVMLPLGASMRVYGSHQGKIVSARDILVRHSGRFRGTLNLSRAVDAIEFEIFRTAEVRRPGCIPKLRKLVVTRASSTIREQKWVHPLGLLCPGVRLAVTSWRPRLTLHPGCGTRFTTLYDMKRHVCCKAAASKRKQSELLLELSGRNKIMRI